MASKLISSLRKSTVFKITSLLFSLLLLTGCEKQEGIVSNVEEREANEIIVFLASKNIQAYKTAAISSSPGASQSSNSWAISVNSKMATDAMALLNQNGLPRIKGVSLLDLFAKQGLMSSEKEELIRYQAGLAEQIASTIRKIDGVIDADVQISFPSDSSNALPGESVPEKTTAAVYVKHQGILDDPNSHLILKIKRLVSGSINNLSLNDVTVISDKARFTDISLSQMPESLSPLTQNKEYVSIWSIVLNKDSASRFRALFFFLAFGSVLLLLISGWLIWKLYPSLKRKGGIKKLLDPTPFSLDENSENDKTES